LGPRCLPLRSTLLGAGERGGEVEEEGEEEGVVMVMGGRVLEG